ncbi:MAG: type II toxin-antitoxin system YafQ family toxin [Victivallales bacterium]|nr:type II toxin-antitoxin system YafQ family toxin [Victivallales bacterium]
MKYRIRTTSHFRKDYKLMRKRDLDLSRLEYVINCLANGEQLDAKYHDHPLLGGEYSGTRECHIAPDWLLVYYYEDDILVLTLARTGTHSDLFG